MNHKFIIRAIIAVAIYAISVALVLKFYDDNPSKMQWEEREDYIRNFLTTVELNKFTFDEALHLLGSPDITEAKRIDNDYYQVTFYRTHHVKSDGITTQEECTPLLFKNNLLLVSGKNAYESFKLL